MKRGHGAGVLPHGLSVRREPCPPKHFRYNRRMFASLISSLENPEFLLASVPGLIFTIFTLWMVVHAVRQRDWVWVVFMVVFPLCALWYFFQFYRSGDLSTRGFELPGADSRRRIKELKAQIHHLDKPHHHLQLGDIYFQRGKLDLAEAEYRTALERDSADPDIRSARRRASRTAEIRAALRVDIFPPKQQ